MFVSSLALLAFVAYVHADPFVCTTQWVVPSKSLVAAGPSFNTPTGTNLISTSDNVDFIFQNPMVVNGSHNTWQRELKFFFADTATTAPTTAGEFNDAWTAAGNNCKFSQAAGVSVTALAATSGVSGQSSCAPTFTLTQSWEQIRDATDGCGLVEVTSDPAYFKYFGKVFVMWTDSDDLGLNRPADMTYYPVTFQFQKALNQTTSEETDKTEPYIADSFQVTGVSYIKSGTQVTLKVAYQVSTQWPYFPMPNRGGADLVSGLPVSPIALTVPYAPEGDWTNYGVATGGDFVSTTNCGVTPGSPGSATGGICTFTQELQYTWTTADHCDAGSTSDFKINFATCVYSSTNGATNEGCLNKDLKDAGGVSVGSFKINTGINLCAAPENAYTLSSTVHPWAPDVATVDVGKQVSLSTTITSSGKKINHVQVWDAYAGNANGRWNFVTAGTSNNGMISATTLTHNAASCLDADATKLNCAFNMKYTPNVGATDRSSYMIVLADRGGNVAFENVLRLRVFWDSVNTNGGSGLRRLMYRDQVINSISQSGDITQAATQNVRVPSTLSATEGAATVQTSTLSAGAIAGIAVGAVAVVGAAAGVAAVVIRKRRVVVADVEKSTKY